MKTLLATLLATTLLALPAQADLISFDWEQEGDAGLSVDTNSGLLWLDLTYTQNLSINDTLALLDTDPRFAGWRLPTYDEIYGLAASLFTKVNNTSQNTTYTGTPVPNAEKAAHAIMGANIPNYTYGIYTKDTGGTFLFGSSGNGVFYNYAWSTTSRDWSRNYEGVYLVADSVAVSIDSVTINNTLNPGSPETPATDVNAPGTLAAALALLGVGFRRRRPR